MKEAYQSAVYKPTLSAEVTSSAKIVVHCTRVNDKSFTPREHLIEHLRNF